MSVPVRVATVQAESTAAAFGTFTFVADQSGADCGASELPDGGIVPLTTSPFIIGRYHDKDLHLTNPCISGRHCIFTKRDKGIRPMCGHTYEVVLADTSSNGCFRNGARLGCGKTAVLEDGDLISLVSATRVEHHKYNLTVRFNYPPLPADHPATSAPKPVVANIVESIVTTGDAGTTQKPLETAPMPESQFIDNGDVNLSDIDDSDDENGAFESCLDGSKKRLAGTSSSATAHDDEFARVPSIKHKHIDTAYTLDMDNPLGSGSFATVYRASHNRTGRVVAVKQINKKRFVLNADVAQNTTDHDEQQRRRQLEKDMLRQKREVEILLAVKHPHVVRCYGVYETDDWLWFVLSYAAGGELYTMLKSLGAAPEPLVRRVTGQLMSAVHYLHSIGVVHRDIKLENLLLHKPIAAMPDIKADGAAAFDEWLETVHVQVSDFGLSRVIGSDTELMTTMCGTLVYAAPEVVDTRLRIDGPKGYTPAVDLYSVGVVAYALLTGRPPYPYAKDPRTGERNRNRIDYSAKLQWPRSTGLQDPGASAEAKHLVQGLLMVNPRQRLSSADCLAHPWLVGGTMAQWPREVDAERGLRHEASAGRRGRQPATAAHADETPKPKRRSGRS